MKRSLNRLFKLLAEFMDLVKLFPAQPWEPNNFYGKKDCLLTLSEVGTEKLCSCQGLECINLQLTQRTLSPLKCTLTAQEASKSAP